MIDIVKYKKSDTYNAPDITITLSAPHRGKQYGLITMRNDVWKAFETGYVKLSYDAPKGRLYMWESDKKDGYHMYARGADKAKSKNRYLRIGQRSFLDLINSLIGDYNLNYDSYCDGYYIAVQ